MQDTNNDATSSFRAGEKTVLRSRCGHHLHVDIMIGKIFIC